MILPIQLATPMAENIQLAVVDLIWKALIALSYNEQFIHSMEKKILPLWIQKLYKHQSEKSY